MIQAAGILLRAIETTDAVFYQRWINDAETNYWRGLYHPTSQKEAQSWIDEAQISSASTLNLAIVDPDYLAEPIGFIGLRAICPRSRRAEIWIYVGEKKKWNQGIATKAVRGLVSYAFSEMNLHRIWLECDPNHFPAVRCYEKVGFIKEGLLRDSYYRRGEFRNSCVMGLLKNDFKG